MILSVSRRTDIPALYSEWFFQRLHEGFVLVPNPMNARQISRIKLNPQVIECIVFWSKNPLPMLPRLGELEDYSYYFLYTLNAYGRDIEPGLPALAKRIETLCQLSQLLGPERVIWRYDPIFINERYSLKWHKEQYALLAERLAPYTRHCIISFVDIYPKNARRMRQAGINPLSVDQILAIAQSISRTAGQYDLKISTCSEEIDLADLHINHAGCIDRQLIESCTGKCFAGVGKDKNQRPECGCLPSIDIGVYNTCIYGCAYCYANFSSELARRKYAEHDSGAPILTGTVPDNAVIRDRELKIMGHG